jgi:hypothetical protein
VPTTGLYGRTSTSTDPRFKGLYGRTSTSTDPRFKPPMRPPS